MPQLKLLEKAVKVLSENSMQYMLTGSIVSSLQGIPRSTNDVEYMDLWAEKLGIKSYLLLIHLVHNFFYFLFFPCAACTVKNKNSHCMPEKPEPPPA